MIIAKKIYVFFLIVFPALLTGCGTTMGTTSAQRAALDSAATASPADATGNSVNAAILSQIPSMKTGENSMVGSVTVVAGAVYAAASSRRCRPLVVIDGGIRRERVACENDRNWFFSKPVFVKGESE
ncbi:MAG: hypothetical protein GXP17_10410 [Gammaproteobacteria bacterium]|nr:hypothetical protein [Gammaproteobacteria bacterium]